MADDAPSAGPASEMAPPAPPSVAAADDAMMPPPAAPAPSTRTSARTPKPTLKMRGYNEAGSDEDDDDEDDYERTHGRRRSSRATRTLRPALKPSDSATPGPSFRPSRVKLSLRSGHMHRGKNDPSQSGRNKTYSYMQGYDRELDSSDEETGEGMAFEEQLILRMPEGHEATRKLGEWARRREVGTDGREVEFKFKDSRRAIFKMGEQMFSAKLVDLPAIIESHKTLDNKQLFKIADISQMLLVTNEVADEAEVTRGQGVNVEGLTDDFVYDHGITPPMKWARKRRFRKRIHKRTIETVEKEVERLLADDERAEKIEFNMIDQGEADMSDPEDGEGGQRGRRGIDGDSTMGDDASTNADGDDRSQLGDMDDMSMMADDDFDQDLQRQLEEEMLLQQQEDEGADDNDDASSTSGRRSRQRSMSRATSDDEEEEEDDFDDDLFGGEADVGAAASANTQEPDPAAAAEDADDDDEDLDEDEQERRVRGQQLEAECREIEAMVKRKQTEIDGTANALIKQRNSAALKRIQTELDMKRAQLSDLRRERREGKEAARAEAKAQAEVAAAAAAPADTGVVEEDDTVDAADLEAPAARKGGAAREKVVDYDDAEANDGENQDGEEDEGDEGEEDEEEEEGEEGEGEEGEEEDEGDEGEDEEGVEDGGEDDEGEEGEEDQGEDEQGEDEGNDDEGDEDDDLFGEEE